MIEISVAPLDPIAILNMAESSGCSTYDVTFVWLAMELGLPLVTADREVIKAFPGTALDLSGFA